jgi:YD repeat-containing protein
MVDPVYGKRGALPYLQPTEDFLQALANAGAHTEPGGTDSGGGTVKRSPDGKVVEVDFPNGHSRLFHYDTSGKLDRVVQPDGVVYQLVNGKWDDGTVIGPDFLNPDVSSDGTLSYWTSEGALVKDYNDGTQTTTNEDLSIVTQGFDGNVTEVIRADGSQMKFSYDGSGNITQIDDNGKIYTVDQDSQEILDPDGNPTGNKYPYVNPDGVFHYDDKNGQDHRIYPHDHTVYP